MAFFLSHVIGALARQRPDRILFRAPDGTTRTAADLADRSTRLAGALASHGLASGDLVGVWLEDGAEIVETYLALSAGGFVAVPLGRLLTAEEAAYILTDVGAAAVVYSATLKERAAQALASCGGHLRLVVSVGDAPADAAYDDLIDRATPLDLDVSAPDTPMMVAYSSGTTGFPKGVVLTGAAIEAATRMSGLARRLRPWGVAVQPASLSFPAMVTAELFSHLRTGSTFVLTGGWGPHVLEAVTRLGATYLFVPSPVMAAFAATVEHDPTVLRTLTTVSHGGSLCPPEVVRRVIDATGERFTELWGMIENSGAPLTATTHDDARANATGAPVGASAGTVLPGCEVRVVDAAGEPVGDPDAAGELLVRSPSLFRGYWNNPSATEAAWHDGWYRTGDIGRLDGAGRVYVLDRRQDVIISGGINIYPSELERVIHELPGVRDVAVIGVRHDRWGRTPVAVVVGDADLTEARVVEHCRQHLASYKKPTHVVFRDALPRNASNKVLRRVLIDELDA